MTRADVLHVLFSRATERFNHQVTQLRQLPTGPAQEAARRRLRLTGRVILRLAQAEVAALQQGA
jgi:hypothetical protein